MSQIRGIIVPGPTKVSQISGIIVPGPTKVSQIRGIIVPGPTKASQIRGIIVPGPTKVSHMFCFMCVCIFRLHRSFKSHTRPMLPPKFDIIFINILRECMSNVKRNITWAFPTR